MKVLIKNYIRMDISQPKEVYTMTLLEFNSLLVFINNHKTLKDFKLIFDSTQLQNYFKNFVIEFFEDHCVVSQLLNNIKQEKILIIS